MILSEDRQSHLTHVVVDGIWKDDLVEYANEDDAIRVGKKGMAAFIAELERADATARKMVASLKRDVQEGSPEWDVMYRKYLEEELRKQSGNT